MCEHLPRKSFQWTNKNIKKAFVKEWLLKQSVVQEAYKATKKKIFPPIYSETPFSFQMI